VGFWGRWFRSQPTSIVYPHAIVNLNVSDAAFALLPKGSEPTDGPVLAASDVLRDVDPPRAVFYFHERSGVTEALGRLVAHEVSHVVPKLLGVPDRTHDKDGGRV